MNIYDNIRDFWNEQPCGSTHMDYPLGSKEYFDNFDPYYIDLYPYLLPFIDLESLKGRTVMEIGLGSGVTLHRISEVADMCFGLDISDKTIELNEKRKALYSLKYDLINASATQIPLEDNSVDVVVSIGCLHHIPDIDKAIAEIHRVLKPNGLLKGMVYYRHSYRNRFYIPRMIRKNPKWKGKTVDECICEMYDGKGNPYGVVYSKEEIQNLLAKFSITKFQIENFEGSELGRAWGIIPRKVWLATLGKVLGLDLYFVAKAIK